MSNQNKDDVLEQNVSTLLESGGEAPKLTDVARARMRSQLIAKHGVEGAATKSPMRGLRAAGIGLVAAAAAALIVTRFVGDDDNNAKTTGEITKLDDGSSWIVEGSSKVTVLAERRVRVDGAALLDIAPGNGNFVVETQNGTIHVLGTRFLVDASKERTTTAVVRGQVKLATTDGEVVLHAGEQAVAEPGRPPTRGPAPRLSHLVSWAAQARRRAEHDVRPLRNGTLFARDPGVRNGVFGAEYPLPLKKLGIDIVVENQVARVALDQTFFNAEDRVLEGVYKFGIPSDAALQRLAMYVDGKLTESAVVERMRARRIYEELVYRRVDPALLEWEGTGKVSLRVYPLPARQEKRLMLAYTQSIAKLYGDWSLAVPLPQIDAPVGEVAFDVTVRGCANCEITSTSHPITVDRKGADATITYRKSGDTIGDSLVLRVRDARQKASVVSETLDNARYVMVRSPAQLPKEARTYRPRTWVILDDVSASRGSMERRAQQDLVDAFVRELDEEDKLAVIAFDVAARTKLAPTRVLDIDRQRLRAALRGEGDVGATDFALALDAATKLLAGTNPDDAMIVYLGDGLVTSGARQLDALRRQLAGKAHFIGVGVGDGADTQTLEALAAATGGYSTTVDLADDLGWRAFDLVAALHTSRVTGIDARLVDANGQLVPSTLYVRSPQIADGEELEVVAKLAGDGTPAALELSGTANGATWQQRIALDESTAGAGYLPRLWAHRHIAARMLAKHEPVEAPPCVAVARSEAKPVVPCKTEAQAREQRDEAIRKEVVELGKQYFLLSRHTSLIVLENDAMYAKYGVRKGQGDTWAPYAMPDKIPVITMAQTKPVDVATDAELFRTPMQIFHAYSTMDFGGGLISGELLGWDDQTSLEGTIGTSGLGMRGRGAGGGGATRHGERTRRELNLQDSTDSGPVTGADADGDADGWLRGGAKAKAARNDREELKSGERSQRWRNFNGATAEQTELRTRVTTIELQQGGRWRDKGGRGRGAFAGPMVPQRFTYPMDMAFDDLSAFAPALFADASDTWREDLDNAAAAPIHPIDAASKALLEKARASLPTGVYRWGDLEIAVDASRRMGWRRTTDADLVETASFDGATFTRRYAELGIDVTRPIASDDVALAFAYLPVWIADPSHYARYFEVKAKGPRAVTLSSYASGKAAVMFELEFDANHHLVAIKSGEGKVLLSITWGPIGPVAARMQDGDLTVGFIGQAIGDAAAWAHGTTTAQRTVVELPTRMPAYWEAELKKETVGSDSWRRAQRQYLVSLAATGNRGAQFTVYETLRANGGVELGDLVLASGGVATASTDKQFAEAIAPHGSSPIARYLFAGRAYGKSPQPDRMKPETTAGLVGALWQLREIAALYAASKYTLAVDKLVGLGTRALQFRMLAAAFTTNRYDMKPADVARAWATVAVGRLKNVARSNAAAALYNRGAYEQAADMIALMIEDLDLTADPPFIASGSHALQQSRRGNAGWQLIWARWRDRVLAGTSYEHVIALAQYVQQQPGDANAIFTRAIQLAGDDVDRKIAVANFALQRGMSPLAESLVQDLVKKYDTAALHQLAAQFAQQQRRTADALKHLEAAQKASADEAVSIATVRSELAQIIATAKQLAIESTGHARVAATERAMSWGAKWRAIDPGNPDIDRILGELQLAVGDKAEAWRQLSGVIERDPMGGAGYMTVAEAFEAQGKVDEALDYWQQAIVIEQTNPTPRVRKAQALIALGRAAEGDALLEQVAKGTWHDIWMSQVYQAKNLLERGKPGYGSRF
jgi:tetratricopeptide (TPR) repeat protein